MKHDVIVDRLKLRCFKNKTLFRHPNYHVLQPTDSSSKCTPIHYWPFLAARVYCWLMFHFSLTRSCRWILAELLPSWSALSLNNKWGHSSPYAGLCISLCWILSGSCQSFAPNFQVLTCGHTEYLEWPEQTQHKPSAQQTNFCYQEGLSRGAEQENELLVGSIRKRETLAFLK